MTILENSSTQELIDLDNLLYNDFNTYQDWFDAFKDEDKIRIELIESINEKLKANNYDGPNDYYAMYWFAKGLNLPVPQKPKRYVNSDDYLFNNLHKCHYHHIINYLSQLNLELLRYVELTFFLPLYKRKKKNKFVR